jgi:hypothetical protein
MQRGHTKGFYFNSSYRKTRGLRSLLHGLFHHKNEDESDCDDYTYCDSSSPNVREMESAHQDGDRDMKKGMIETDHSARAV